MQKTPFGSKAATICSIADEFSAEEFGTIMQQISAKTYVGKRMRFSGFVKSKEVFPDHLLNPSFEEV